MNLVERHIISRNHKLWKECDRVCSLSKDLYNAALDIIREEFNKTGKWIRYAELDKLLRNDYPKIYYILPSNVTQQILRKLDNNLKSYFQAIKSYKRNKTGFLGLPQFPKNKHEIKGRNIIISDTTSPIKNSFIQPTKHFFPNIPTKVPQESYKRFEIIPQNSCYIINVIYEKEEIINENPNNNWLAIDLGVNNLATCITNTSKEFIINGKPLKSINQYYNKKMSSLQEDLIKRNPKRRKSKATEKLTLKRNNKIQDYTHKSSKYIIKFCKDNNIDNIVIGKNKNWKQKVNIGRKNNQNFVQIPFDKFINQINYKGKLQGIQTLTVNEAYTSKCSAFDFEKIQKHIKYVGIRTYRGLFKTKSKRKINADSNGAANILRKVVGNVGLLKSYRLNRGLAVSPVKINFS